MLKMLWRATFYGVISRETLTIEGRFHLGSNVKAMTATIAMILVEEGRFSWSSTIAARFPDVAVDAGYKAVTLAEVASHRAGLPASFSDDDLAAIADVTSVGDARLTALRRVLARPPAAQRGAFAYSNVGYVLLGAAIEAIEKRQFEQVLRARLFEPLGMSSCVFLPPGVDAVDPWHAFALGHDGARHPVLPKHDADPPVYVPAGASVSPSLTRAATSAGARSC
jgi:CubicO group peptidase (beta-lactamase class C family)